MDGELDGIISLNPRQLKKEHARHQAMRDNLKRRKAYKKALEDIKLSQINAAEHALTAVPAGEFVAQKADNSERYISVQDYLSSAASIYGSPLGAGLPKPSNQNSKE